MASMGTAGGDGDSPGPGGWIAGRAGDGAGRARDGTAGEPGSASGAGQGFVADGGPDAQPGLVQPALEGGLADTGDLGGLLRGQALDVAQHQGGPQRRWQIAQGPGQGPAQFAVLGLPGWIKRNEGGQLEFVRSERHSR